MIKVNDRIEFLNEVKGLFKSSPIAIEIGIYMGDFSQQILEILHPKVLFLIDPFVESDATTYPDGTLTVYSNENNYRIVRDKFGNNVRVGIDKNYSYNAVSEYADNLIDFIYHDASHLYADLKKDLNDWLPKLTANGLMCGHDYGGIFEGVKQAVDEFMIEHNFEMIILNENGGDFALKRCTA